MPRLALATVACLFLLPACTTLRGRAEAAYAKGNYLDAAELYDELARDDPKDTAAIAARDRARQAAIRVDVEESASLRASHHDDDAAEATVRALGLVHGWHVTPEAKVAGELATSVAAAAQHVRDGVLAATPLRGEALVGRWSSLLANPELAEANADVRAIVLAKGRARCDELSVEGPWARWMVARYCGHFGLERERPPLPELRRGLVAEGALAGATRAENAALASDLANAFTRTVWFDAAATGGPIHATLSGRFAATIGSRRVTLTKNWTESVPYTDWEDVEESYQEPYTDTEFVTKQVPYTEYRTRTYPCGDTTCTETVPETCYRTETETQMVTKYRTAYRTVRQAVTKYRDVPQIFHYDADEWTGSYDATIRVSSSDPAFVATENDALERHGYEHDVTFEPAGVAPERSGVLSRAQFFVDERNAALRQVVATLNGRWKELHCATFDTLDGAASCAYLDAKGAPAAAHARIAQTFGDEEPLLAPLLVR
jgi:hypothetical protein